MSSPEDWWKSPREERAALIALYNSTGGSDWRKNAGWLSEAPITYWHGVKTGPGNHVITLNLLQNNLRGELPAELGNLSKLESLALNGNQITGDIPSELGNLRKLRILTLTRTPMIGCVPRVIRGRLISDYRKHLVFCKE